MLAYARLRPGEGFQAWRALFYYAQRMITAPPARRAVCALIAAVVRARRGGGRDRPTGADHARIMTDLKRDGLARLPPLASDAAIAAMRAYFSAQPVLDASGRESAVEDLPDASTAAYGLKRVLACPGLLEMLNAPCVLRIASDYLGCQPTLSSVGVRWSFPTAGPIARTQTFHRDLDDWRFLKLFVYLTDVDEGSGPHCYVRTSQASAFGWTAKAYSQAELEHRFGADKLTVIVGRRGTTFIADTLGVHRGVSPAERPRLILQAQYSLLPVFAFLYAPEDGIGPEGAAYCNRLMLTGRPPPQ